MTIFTKRRKSREGYTLLEIGLALGIMAIVFVTVVPASMGFIGERRIREVADEIRDLATTTRRHAQEEGKYRTLVFDKSTVAMDEEVTELPPGIRLLVRKGAGKWTQPKEEPWKFAPNGLVEPLSLRLERNGKWLEIDFDPLTAMVAEERYSF